MWVCLWFVHVFTCTLVCVCACAPVCACVRVCAFLCVACVRVPMCACVRARVCACAVCVRMTDSWSGRRRIIISSSSLLSSCYLTPCQVPPSLTTHTHTHTHTHTCLPRHSVDRPLQSGALLLSLSPSALFLLSWSRDICNSHEVSQLAAQRLRLSVFQC